MNLSQMSIKYFKLAVGTLKRQSSNKLTCDCPLCGDKKGRLSITAVSDDDGVVGCFNAGCELNDQQMPLGAALSHLSPGLENQYRKERFKQNINELKDGKLSLNSILNNVNASKEKTKDRIERVLVPKIDFILPKMFVDLLTPLKDVPEAVKYLEKRKITPRDNWYYCYNQFMKIIDKDYFVENFIFIPLIQYGKLKGFYTRSIYEKRFSTMIFPGGEKYWCCEDFDPNETVYIFEGIFDAIASGLTNVIASMSADLPQDLLDELKDPVFCHDLDKTGVSKSIEQAVKGHKVFVWPVELQEYKDMNDALIDGETSLSNYILDNIHTGVSAQIRLPLSLS